MRETEGRKLRGGEKGKSPTTRQQNEQRPVSIQNKIIETNSFVLDWTPPVALAPEAMDLSSKMKCVSAGGWELKMDWGYTASSRTDH